MSTAHPETIETPEFAELLRELASQAVEELITTIKRLDDSIGEADYLLNDFQPFRTGKIRIKFQMIDELQRPVPIVWRRSKIDGKWKSDKIGRTRLSMRGKRARDFEDNKEVVAELLGHSAELIEMRSNLIQSVTNMRMSASQQLKVVRPKVEDILHRLRCIIMERDDGLHRTFISEPSPPQSY